MFEKEAEEYATKKVGDFKPIQEDKETEWMYCYEDFQKGAEFGFNKDNEWHDLRKNPNDLPVFETELLCQKSSGRCFIGYHKDNKFYSHETGKSYDVVRWLDIGVWWNIPQFEE